MRRFSALLMATGLVACGGGDNAADDVVEVEGVPAGIALADVAGSWNLTGTPEMEPFTPTSIAYSMTATDSAYGWTFTFPEQDPLDIRIIAVEGDSIVVEAGPFESVIRDGVMVSTRTVMRLEDGMLVGTFLATYETDPVETLAGTVEGTRAMP